MKGMQIAIWLSIALILLTGSSFAQKYIPEWAAPVLGMDTEQQEISSFPPLARPISWHTSSPSEGSMITSDGDDISLLLGTWHLPGGNITINDDDIDQMKKNINSDLKEITPRKIFVYAMIKYHHTYDILLPGSAIESGLQNLSEMYNILNSTKSEIRSFWAYYMTLNHKSDPKFGTQQGILDDWNLYNMKVDIWRLGRIVALQEPFITSGEMFEKVMNAKQNFDYNVIQRDYHTWLSDQSYRTELNAQWALGQANYEVWKSQIER
jgi:hypothetical protein